MTVEMDLWALPSELEIGGKYYPIRGDFRDILRIFRYLEEDVPLEQRWRKAAGWFYREEVPQVHFAEAVRALAWFIRGGREEVAAGPKLMDWHSDAAVIAADVNRVAGMEVRAVPFLHWWTFLGYFYSIGDGLLAVLVTIRGKVLRGEPLEAWEWEVYGRHRMESPEEAEQRARLEALLGEM